MGTIKYDKPTSEWFKIHRIAETTVCRCNECGLYYKPELGHKCLKDKGEEE